jgi:sulfur-oxidizing protein SoxY
MHDKTECSDIVERRNFLKWGTAGAFVLTLVPFSVEATPETVAETLGKLVGGMPLKEGPISITLPEIAENGAVVALTVAVDSPMTADDHIKAIHILADGNPLPDVASYFLGPHNGKAEVALRMRLAKTQKIVFAAETSKGEAYIASQMVKVTLGGCGG